MRVVITGASGFLGQNLVKRLSEREDISILALTSRPETLCAVKNVTACNKDAIFTDEQPLQQGDILIHCAFPRTAAGAEFASGLAYVARVLEEAERKRIRGVINISSQSVYDSKRTEAASETDAVCPEGGYAIGKYAQELMGQGICCHVPITSLRMASLIGPGFDQRLTNKMVDFALTSGKLTVKDNQQYFGFLDVADAVSGICALLDTAPQKWHAVYNLGASSVYTLPEIACMVKDAVEQQTGKTVDITVQEGTECSNSGLNCQLLHQAAGYAPQITMEESIQRILLHKCKSN